MNTSASRKAPMRAIPPRVPPTTAPTGTPLAGGAGVGVLLGDVLILVPWPDMEGDGVGVEDFDVVVRVYAGGMSWRSQVGRAYVLDSQP